MNPELRVELGDRSYPIHIGPGLLADEELFRTAVPSDQVMILTDDTVAPLYLDRIRRHFQDRSCEALTLPDGEIHKSLSRFEEIVTFMLERGFERSASLVALGGGVVGDLGGFHRWPPEGADRARRGAQVNEAWFFRSQGIANMASAIVGAVTALVLALLDYGVWALIFAPIAAFFVRGLMVTIAARLWVMPVSVITAITFVAALTQGNVGTAFRHRGQLVVLLAIPTVAGFNAIRSRQSRARESVSSI